MPTTEPTRSVVRRTGDEREGAGAASYDGRATKGGTMLVLGVVCFGSLLLQSAHMVEHVVQVLQKFVFAVPAHGLLGEALDREWVHLAYNGSLEGALLLVLFGYGFHRGRDLRGGRSPALYVLYGVVGLQGYHVAEHVIKVAQYLASGLQDTPGLLGSIFPLIWVHFTINLIVLSLMVAAYFGLGLVTHAWRDVATVIRRLPLHRQLALVRFRSMR